MGCGRPQMMMVIGNIQSKYYGNKPSGDGREKQQKKQ
jgi:hypothetical protein